MKREMPSTVPRRRGVFFTTAGGLLGIAVLVWAFGACWFPGKCAPTQWTPAEIQMLRSLSLDALPSPPTDPSNSVADTPRAASLGHRFFFDPRLSVNGKVACATCHQPERRFSDGMPKGRAIGTSRRNTLSIVASAYSPWLYWDGRKDSQWSQALAPLEDPAEHGGNRMQYARLIADDPTYRNAYEELFGPLPDFSDRQRFPSAATPLHNSQWQDAWQAMNADDQNSVNDVFANIGKAIAAYERLLVPGPSRFDRYVKAVLSSDSDAQNEIFSPDEAKGLRLFIGKARCTECHNGPLFTNNEFHNTGVLSLPGELPDRGRSDGVRTVKADPFNCMGPHSDAEKENCAELRFVRTGEELIGAMKTPSLRNLAGTAPFMHKGQMATLTEVLEHYNQAPDALIGHNEAEALGLSRRELGQMEAFLDTLSAPLATHRKWLSSPEPN